MNIRRRHENHPQRHQGVKHEAVHKLAWDAFFRSTWPSPMR